MKINLQQIMAISGQPGLYRHLSQGKNGIIVESLVDGKRMCAGASMRITTLSDVAIYTDTEELPLREVLEKIKAKHKGAAAIDPKSDSQALQAYFAEVVPQYDRDRFYTSHMKKALEWYNLLQKNDMLDFETEDGEPAATDKNE